MPDWVALIANSAAANPGAPGLGGGGALAVDPVRVLAGLGAGILLSLLAALLIARMKRAPGRAPRWMGLIAPAVDQAAQLRILETRRASVHADFCLVSWNGRRYLVAVTPGGASLIDARTDSEGSETADPDAPETSA